MGLVFALIMVVPLMVFGDRAPWLIFVPLAATVAVVLLAELSPRKTVVVEKRRRASNVEVVLRTASVFVTSSYEPTAGEWELGDDTDTWGGLTAYRGATSDYGTPSGSADLSGSVTVGSGYGTSTFTA